MGHYRLPFPARTPRDAHDPSTLVPAPRPVSAPAIPARRRLALPRCPHGRRRLARPDGGPVHLAGPHLFAARDVGGVPRADLERGPFLSGGGRPVNRPSPGPGPAAVLVGHRGLLSGPQAAAGTVLRGGGSPHGAGVGRRRGGSV